METVLACSTVPYESVALERALEGIAAAGFKSVVVGPAHGGEAVLDTAAGPDGAAGLKAALEKAGLEAVALWPEFGPTDEDAAAAVVGVIEQAKAVGARQVWISGPSAFDEKGEIRSDEEWERDVEALASNAGAVAAKAKELGVEIAFPTEARLTGCGEEIEKLFSTNSAIGDAGITVAYNPGLVSYFTGVNPIRDLEAVAGRVSALCIRDHSGAVGEANFPAVGGGDIDYIQVFGTLSAGGFAAPVVVEHLNGEGPEELDASAKQAFRFVDMLVKQA